MPENSPGCSNQDCGCHLMSFMTHRECPVCQKKLRLTGRSQRIEFRLSCQSCGYQSPLLTPEQLQDLI